MTEKGTMVTWRAKDLPRFARAQEQAAARKSKSFHFDGNEYDVGYAKYLLMHLEERFNVHV